MAGQLLREPLAVPASEPIQRQPVRAPLQPLPLEIGSHRQPQAFQMCLVPHQEIQPLWQILHAMHEQRRMHLRVPSQRPERQRHLPPLLVPRAQFPGREAMQQYLVERVLLHHVNPVHVHRAPPLPNDLSYREILVQLLRYQPARTELADGEPIPVEGGRLLDRLCGSVNRVPVDMLLAEGIRLSSPLQVPALRHQRGVVEIGVGAEGEYLEEAVGVLGFDPREVSFARAVGKGGRGRGVGLVDAEELLELLVAESVEETDVPAEGGGGDGYRGDGVADVVVAVAEGALAVLPGLAPEDGREGQEEGGGAAVWEEGSGEVGAEVEGVVLGRVVGEERGGGDGRDGRREDVGFGGVEVAAAGIDAEGPGGEGSGLPGGEGEGVVEEAGEGSGVEWSRGGRWGSGEEGGVGGGIVGKWGEVEERGGGGGGEAEEGVGLVGPVEAVGASSVAGGERVLGAVVVGYCLLYVRLLVRVDVGVGVAWLHGSGGRPESP